MKSFNVYPLPTRVTYTREVDFDAAGRVWTSNSNGPTWQIEGGIPHVIRLDPRDGALATAGVARIEPRVRRRRSPLRTPPASECVR